MLEEKVIRRENGHLSNGGDSDRIQRHQGVVADEGRTAISDLDEWRVVRVGDGADRVEAGEGSLGKLDDFSPVSGTAFGKDDQRSKNSLADSLLTLVDQLNEVVALILASSIVEEAPAHLGDLADVRYLGNATFRYEARNLACRKQRNIAEAGVVRHERARSLVRGLPIGAEVLLVADVSLYPANP